MIKFFRKIRQQLLTENKFSKYLIYALGEILLVVIGILIALQINNWNQIKNDKIMIGDYLFEIIEDLNNDIESYQHNRDKYKTLVNNKEWGMSKSEYSISQKDSLLSFMFIDITDYKIMDLAFQKLQNSGLTRFYEFEKLIDEIRDYYLVTGKQYDIWIDWEVKWSDNELQWWHNNDDHFEWSFTNEFPQVNEENYNINELIKVLESAKGRNQMYYSLIRKRILLSQFEKMLNQARELKVMIEERYTF
ncbi:MAG: hypothetical protein HKN87_13870 [Saprospiraceae bacterium]|nr:hypothetical protein [Saprospiraceae bacterium]